jgi:hypothetical protein
LRDKLLLILEWLRMFKDLLNLKNLLNQGKQKKKEYFKYNKKYL